MDLLVATVVHIPLDARIEGIDSPRAAGHNRLRAARAACSLLAPLAAPPTS